ncbi:hypothetical protein CFB46_03545 [Burkholderia sp. HI2761]|nr:hypothetical protein [Burkholderia sp. BE24]OXJ30261.1 hypothetical protein CFB46_03545 [Burkholderia sp. HI2761]
MPASENRAARPAHTTRYGDERARDAALRSSADTPRQGSAMRMRRRVAAHRASAPTHRPNGRRRHASFDFDRPRA